MLVLSGAPERREAAELRSTAAMIEALDAITPEETYAVNENDDAGWARSYEQQAAWRLHLAHCLRDGRACYTDALLDLCSNLPRHRYCKPPKR